MKTEKRNGGPARTVLIGMCTDPAVCGAAAAAWADDGLFNSPWMDLVGNWCVKHYKKYGKPPRRELGSYFDRWCERRRDAEVQDAVGRLLESLSDQHQRKALASDYVLDLSKDVFNKARAERAMEAAKLHLENGDVDKALKSMDEFRPVEIGGGSVIDIFAGGPEFRDAFDADNNETLIDWKHAGDGLKKFFGSVFERESFVSFMGKNKVGKSFWLYECALQAVRCGRRVAFFEVGDQTRRQLTRRIGSRITGIPWKLESLSYPFPTNLVPGDGESPPVVQREMRTAPAVITGKEADRAVKKLGKKYGRDALKMSWHPNRGITVAGIEEILLRLKRDEWVPDVVVIDYAGLLKPIRGLNETRDEINESWQAMRAMSQRWHCAVITATQSDTKSFDAHTLTRTNFVGDRRILDHVTAMIGINQRPSEKDNGVCRLNYVNGRDLDFSEETCCYIAQALAVANPCVQSCF